MSADNPSILFLCGSPRAYGNSMTLAEDLVAHAQAAGCACTVAAPLKQLGFESSQPTFTSLLGIEGCRDCGGCKKTGECVIDDRMRSIYQALERVDGVVWVTPTYFASIPAQLKVVVDRLQALYAQRLLGLIQVGASRKPVLSVVLGSGKDPYGNEAAFTVLESASHMFEGDVIERIAISGVDRAGQIGEVAFEEARARALKKCDAVIEAARVFSRTRL